MKTWLKISLLLSAFGFFKEFRPSEHFIYEFLLPPWRDLTEDQVKLEVYPVATYSYLAQLFIVFLITDLCRYKALIIVLGISGIVVFSMLIWTTSLLNLQIIEVIFCNQYIFTNYTLLIFLGSLRDVNGNRSGLLYLHVCESS